MIKIVNTEYRNIQEQVAKNASDIADLREEIANIDIEDTPEAIQKKQLGFGLIVDPRTNINGKILSSYWVDEVEEDGHAAIRVRTNPQGGLRQELSKAQASNYMLALCGLGYVPEYDFDHPKYHTLIDANGIIYKPQYNPPSGGSFGLRLYIVPSPFQNKLTAGDGISIDEDNVISATSSGGGGAYQHRLSGTTASMDVLSYLIDADPTPINNVNFVERVRFAFVLQSSSKQPFTNYCSQNDQYACMMTWQSGQTTFSGSSVNFQNVSDVVTEL